MHAPLRAIFSSKSSIAAKKCVLFPLFLILLQLLQMLVIQSLAVVPVQRVALIAVVVPFIAVAIAIVPYALPPFRWNEADIDTEIE